MLEHCIMLDDDPELLEDDSEDEEWVEGEEAAATHTASTDCTSQSVSVSNSCAFGDAAGGSGGGGSGGGGRGRFSQMRRGSWTSEVEGDGATSSTIVVSKQLWPNLRFILDCVTHYYPDGTPLDPEHFEVRDGALHRLMQQGARSIWVITLTTVPVQWLKIGPQMEVPVERLREAGPVASSLLQYANFGISFPAPSAEALHATL